MKDYAIFRRTASPIQGLAELKEEFVQGAVKSYARFIFQFLNAVESARTPARIEDGPVLSGARWVDPPALLLQTAETGQREAVRERLRAFWLRAENRLGQIDNDPVLSLRHQAVLVHYITNDPNARRLLIADEVGLGKTLEIGLAMRHFLQESENYRVAYITRGGLVPNVVRELAQLGLTNFNLYANTRVPSDLEHAFYPVNGLLPDGRRYVISMHRLGHGTNWDEQRERLKPTGFKFDMVVVDECHSLRAYGERDDVDAQRWFRVIRELVTQFTVPDARVYFLSGTPHQGNSEVFLNLAGLLMGLKDSEPHEKKREVLKGRVVFRIKEDVRDWENKPLFPGRNVRDPVLVAAPPHYRDLLDEIAEYFDVAAQARDVAATKAIGFVKSQALQYAASSPRAGFAYLVRRYVRNFLEVHSPKDRARVTAWLAKLVPYRGWACTTEELLKEWERELKGAAEQQKAEPVDDLEADEGGEALVEPKKLIDVLEKYSKILDDPLSAAKFAAVTKLVLQHDEPFVIFSQALDTVHELKRWLEKASVPIHLIVGGQEPGVRQETIDAFRTGSGRRVLLSSAAGSEGINLQISRRIIHFDLPWNPMVLEQRIGRVHRIGSIDTIEIDTVLLEGSREQEIYARLRERLASIVKDLTDDEHDQQKLYRRILTSLDASKLKEIFAGASAPEGLGALVREGASRVKEVDNVLAAARAGLGEDDRGRATFGHLVALLGSELIEGPEKTVRSVKFNEETYRLEEIVVPTKSYRPKSGAPPERTLVFDREATALLRLKREEAGGLGNPWVDARLLQLTVVPDEDEYVRRSVAWIRRTSSLPVKHDEGFLLFYLTASILVREGVPNDPGVVRAPRLRVFEVGGKVGDSSLPVELDGPATEQLVTAVQWEQAQARPVRPDLTTLDRSIRELLHSNRGVDAVRSAVWPLAAVGFRA